MAKIPDQLAIRRSIPDGMAPVATIGTRGVGEGFQAVSRSMSDMAERMTRDQVAEAEADFLVAKAQQDNAYDEDEDFATITDRYERNVSEALATSASKISNANIRDQFIQRYRPSVAQGVERASDIAYKRETDYRRGAINTQIEQLRDAAVTARTPEDVAAINNAVTALLDTEWYGKQEGAKALDSFRESVAIGRVRMLDPENRIEALNKEWANALPPETKAQLLREARDAQRVGRVQRIIDDMPEGTGRLEGILTIREKIKDPKDRDAAEREWNNEYSLRKQAKSDRQGELLDKWYDDVAVNGVKVSDIIKNHPDDWNALGASYQSTLINAENNKASGTKIAYNPDAEDLLNSVKNDPMKLASTYKAVRPLMSPEQQKRWSSVAAGGVPEPQEQTIFSAKDAIDQYWRSKEIRDESQKWQYEAEIERRIIDWNRANPGKTMPRNLLIEELDSMFMEYDTGVFSSTPLYRMTPEQKADAIKDIREDDPADFGGVLEIFKLTGAQATRDEILSAYTRSTENDYGWAIRLIQQRDRVLYEEIISTIKQTVGDDMVTPERVIEIYMKIKQARNAAK